eukprot:gene5309-3811_t
MLINDIEGHSLDDLTAIIEKKIAFMEYPPCDYTVFFNEGNGDRVVVDHSYYYRLLSTWKKLPSKPNQTLSESQISTCFSSTEVVSVNLSVEVEVTRIKSFDAPSLDGKNVAPLTVENLTRIKPLSTTDAAVPKKLLNQDGCCISLKNLTCPPQHPDFFVRGVIVAIRMKTAKTGLEVTEMDLCDIDDPAVQVTAVTFDATVRKAVKEHLRADRRQVVEIHRAYVRKKNEVDVLFQANPHPLLLRLDKHSRIEVVQILTVPIQLSHPVSVVKVRQNMLTGGVLDVGTLAVGSMNTPKASSFISSRSEGSANSSSGGALPRRTILSFSDAHRIVPANTPRSAGERHNDTTRMVGNSSRVTKRDVTAREEVVDEYAAKEECRKERIRHRKEISNQCILCGLDCDDEATTLSVVKRLLESNKRNKGGHIPELSKLRAALSDNRRSGSNRLLTNATFVNLDTKTVHRVHCRCAHLCTSYQQGENIEDFVLCKLPFSMCSLCNLPGATVRCYHPDCTEQYHCICALFCEGYVNFGKKDPFMPCPACPRHTQVVLSADPNDLNPQTFVIQTTMEGNSKRLRLFFIFFFMDGSVSVTTRDLCFFVVFLRSFELEYVYALVAFFVCLFVYLPLLYFSRRRNFMKEEKNKGTVDLPPGCHLLRENIFDVVDQDSSDEDLLQRRQPTMLPSGEQLIPPRDEKKRYSIVFDLDETVVYGRDGPLYARAFLKHLFRSIANDFEVIVWTASDRDYAKNVLEAINKDHVIQHLVYRHSKWFTEDNYTKDLKQLGRSLDSTIIIENTPDCIRQNPQNGIIVKDFEIQKDEGQLNDIKQRKRKRTDHTLSLLVEVLLDLAKSGKTVPDFLRSCDMLTKQVVPSTDGAEIPIYFLDGTSKRPVRRSEDYVVYLTKKRLPFGN